MFELESPAVTKRMAFELCAMIESVCPTFGYHVALTGGCLYKEGPRKDVDVLFYRVRQRQQALETLLAMFGELDEQVGLVVKEEKQIGGWLVKATWRGVPVDCFFPEEIRPTTAKPDGTY